MRIHPNWVFQPLVVGDIYKANKDIWVFPKRGVPQNGRFIRENPISIDDLKVPYFWKHPFAEVYVNNVVSMEISWN